MEPVSTGAALVAATAWFANKVLGPSAESLGKELDTYTTNRLARIFARTREKLDNNTVQALPPGFAVQYLQKASLSEDSEILTESWANLLASAATSFQSRHLAYIEILSQMSAFDAQMLEDFVAPDTLFTPQISKPVNLKIELRYRLAKEIKAISDTNEEARDELERLLALDLSWPGRITAGRVHYRDADKEKDCSVSGGVPDQFAAIDNLYRLGLVEHFDVDISMSPYATAVEGVLVTVLGIGFVQTCRGKA